jgi:hypothetical protein
LRHFVEDRKEEKMMRIKNKYKKPTATLLRCYDAGSRCSTSVFVLSLLGCLLLFQLYCYVVHTDRRGVGGEARLHLSHHPQVRELQEVEEENLHVPPPKGKRSPRAVKRRPKRTTTLIDEFLDENSQMRHVFFPGRKRAIDPMQVVEDDKYHYYPGRMWLDTDGHPIQAHGGGILYDKNSRTYYWYGEYKDGPTYHAHKKGAARVNPIFFNELLFSLHIIIAVITIGSYVA